jgi:hypothetical protein
LKQNKRNAFFAVVLISICSGCASSRFPLTPSISHPNFPELNSVITAELGDKVVSKGKIYEYDAILLKNRLSAGDGFFLKKFTVEPGTLIAREGNKQWTYYFSDSDGFKTYDAMIGEYYQPGGLMISKTNGNKTKLFTGNAALASGEKPKYKKTKALAGIDYPTFSQEIIYNGRSGSTVEFMYREYSNDMARAAFTQDFHYDLSEGNIIGFKGVRIEIINATNTALKYRVIKTFPDIE